MPSRRSMMGAQALENARGGRRLRDTFGQFLALTKPRVMSLAIFTAFVGLWTAPRHLDLVGTLVALACIALGAGAAGALNMWYDADIDALMTRTSTRPIPRGHRSRREALIFGLLLAVGATAACAELVNVTAAAMLALTIAYYVVVYTVWLKRRSPQSIVIGGLAGALPPAIGWAATGSPMSLEPILLVLIIFLWTPPHFWALALKRSADYAHAGIPALPVVAGREEAQRSIWRYSLLLVLSSMLPWALGYAETVYAVSAAVLGLAFVGLAFEVRQSKSSRSRSAGQLFGFSILYLFCLFASLLLDEVARSDRLFPTVFETAVAVESEPEDVTCTSCTF
jgi:heme o synthase